MQHRVRVSEMMFARAQRCIIDKLNGQKSSTMNSMVVKINIGWMDVTREVIEKQERNVSIRNRHILTVWHDCEMCDEKQEKLQHGLHLW